MVSYLQENPPRHGELKRLAGRIGVSVRTLYQWCRGGGGGRPRRRPRVPVDHAQSRSWIEPPWRVMADGKNGVRPVRAKLLESKLYVPVQHVREIVGELKQERAEREKTRREAARMGARVLYRDAVWALDQMDLGRDEHGSVRALQADDCCTQRILDATVGPPAQGNDVVGLLERAAQGRGGVFPFVVQVDNGSENANERVRAWAAHHQVILCFNLPHTPEHNPRAERTNGDLRRASGLDKPDIAEPGVFRTRAECAIRLAQAWHALDVCTPRASLGYRTPCELDRIAPRAEDHACRACFYREVHEELERIGRLPITQRARRKQQREAIWCALERHGLVTRTRGGLPVRAFKPEGIT